MSRARSPVRAGAVVFALLSLALHAVVWDAARGAATQAGSEAGETGSVRATPVRLVALEATPPAPPRAVAARESTPPQRAAVRPAKRANRRAAAAGREARRASSTPGSRDAPAPVKPKAAAAPARQPTTPATAWTRPLVLPEFDDSLDAAALASAPRASAPRAAPQPEGLASSSEPAPAHDEPATPPSDAVHVQPASGSVRYLVHYGDPAEGNIVATVEQRYEIGGDRYRLHSEGRASGLASWFYRGTLVQESSGRVSSLGLQPERYRERRGDRAAREAVLDVDGERVRLPSGRDAALPPGAQDRLSVLVQLGLLLHSDPSRFEPGAIVELPVLASSRVTPASWRVLGRETVVSGDAAVAALHLRRDPVDDDDPAVDVWLSLAPRTLPLRVRVTESTGRALDQIAVVDDR